MEARVLYLDEGLSIGEAVDTAICFRPFIRFLEEKAENSQTFKTKFYRFLLAQFNRYAEPDIEFRPEDAVKYEHLLELMYALLSSTLEDEENELWALSVPLEPVLFYGTAGLYDKLIDPATARLNRHIVAKDPDMFKKRRFEMIYSLILERLYAFPPVQKHENIHAWTDQETGLPRYHRINGDTRFVEVTATGPLPELNFEILQSRLQEETGWNVLSELLPLSLFRFRGITVLTLTEVTAHYAVENIKNTILNRTSQESVECYGSIFTSLKTLAGSNAIEFELLPIFRINQKLVLDHKETANSIILSKSMEFGIEEADFISMIEQYTRDPKVLFFKDLAREERSGYLFLAALREAGIASFGLFPVFFNNRLVGLLEVYTNQKGLLDEKTLAGLEPAIPLLAQLLQNSIDEFDAAIENVIREKFTSLQPSVQWKFNEAVWRYLQESGDGKKGEIGTIHFDNVYPLYGAIDIRDSTYERNEALKLDLQVLFDILLEALLALKQREHLALIDEMIFKCRKWRESIQSLLTANEEILLNEFFEKEAAPFLRHFKRADLQADPLIDAYFAAIEEHQGAAGRNRRDLETSIQMINSAIGTYLDLMKEELQQSYPCYFERFRTDGVEYDIYIGQSIAPARPFDILYLKNLRLWQLSSMVAITRLTQGLLPRMPKALHTTQLIFIHTSTIDVSFRNDERRFDVEGGYNTRYQVIKKRIDKVHVRDTGERLTLPGKIALVYFNQKDADEYVEYIRYLQERQMLCDDLEWLELEALQGVAGLKALRVGVTLETG